MTDECEAEQAMELEAVESIYGADFAVLEAADDGARRVSVRVASAVAPDIECRCLFTLGARYPLDEPPALRLVPLRGLSTSALRKVTEQLAHFAAHEARGAAAIFAICSRLTELLDERSGAALDDDDDDAAAAAAAAADNAAAGGARRDVSAVAFVGTRVTPESFDAWKAAFDAEQAAARVASQKSKDASRKPRMAQTGREYFEAMAAGDAAGDDEAPAAFNQLLFEAEADIEDFDFSSDEEEEGDDDDV